MRGKEMCEDLMTETLEESTKDMYLQIKKFNVY